MGELATSRRGLLASFAAVSAVAGSVAVHAAPGVVEKGTEAMNMHTTILRDRSSNAGRIAWDRAMVAWEAAKRADELYGADVWTPLHTKLESVAPRPDLFFEITARTGHVARYPLWPADLHAYDDHVSPLFRDSAAKVRDAWLTHQAAANRLGYDSATDEAERLSGIACDRERELMLLPAPDAAALLWKLERLFGSDARTSEGGGTSWSGRWLNALMDDAHRLLGREVA